MSATYQTATDSSAGFTLLEVMLSIAILAVVGLASAMVMIPVVQAQNESREFTEATAMSRAVLEELYSRSLEELTNTEDGYLLGSNWPQKGTQIYGETPTLLELSDPTIPSVMISTGDLDADPIEILVTVTWSGRDSGPIQKEFWVVRTR